MQHINEIIEGGTWLSSGGSASDPLPEAVVVAVGLGARFLGGVEDKAMYPVRGQTVLIRAPWVRFGKTEATESDLTYIIPRRNGDVRAKLYIKKSLLLIFTPGDCRRNSCCG